MRLTYTHIHTVLTFNYDLWPGGFAGDCEEMDWWLDTSSCSYIHPCFRLQSMHNASSAALPSCSLIFIIHVEWSDSGSLNAHEYLSDESLIKPFLFGSVMSQSGFPFTASSAQFNGLYLFLYKCYSALIQQQPPALFYTSCAAGQTQLMGMAVLVVPIVPVAICGSIILNSKEQENHFCGGCHLLFRTAD